MINIMNYKYYNDILYILINGCTVTNLPTTRQLQYFIALEKYRHFGRAAAACFVSQPAFSIAIREFEHTLGLKLVDRTNKKVTITRIGQDIATQSRLVLRDLQDLVETARIHTAPLSGRLQLGVIPTVAPFLLPSLLPKLRRHFPELRLILHEDQTLRIYEALMEGELDIILIALPFELRNVEVMKLFTDPFHLAFRSGTALLDPADYRIEQLPAESVLLMEDGHCLRDHALTACKMRNVDKVSLVTASSLLTLIEMVDADLGVTYLPEMALGSWLLKNTRVRTVPLKSAPHREIGLIWRKGSARSGEFRELGQFIRDNR